MLLAGGEKVAISLLLYQLRQRFLGEVEGILHVRTWFYSEPDPNQRDAPGVGNPWLSMSED